MSESEKKEAFMNELKETVKYLRKEHIYRNYILLINNKKEYDKITRYQMVLEIYQQYNKNPELIYEVCSTEELLFLKKIVENKIVENKIVESELIYTLDDYNVYKSLVHKFLISYISPKNIMQVPIELNDSIKGALKDFHEDKSREKDNLNYLIIGLIRIYYILSIDEIYDYVNQHHNISYVDFTNYLENNLYLKRYIISAINQDREKLYYSLEYHEFLDDVLEYLDKNDYHFNHDFKYEEIISIGKHGLNLEDKDIKKLYNLILKKITVLFKAQQFLEDFILIASLNDSKNYARLIEYLTFNDEDINISNKLIEVMNNAYNKMPSWRNSGVPPYYARESINKKNQETQFIIDSRPKIGRNDPCPCGSGQKYKKCCLNKKKDPIENIVLTSEDSSLFYELLTQLCAFTNQKHNIINQNLTPDAFYNKNKTVKTELLLEIKDKLWNDKEIIKEFIMANPYNLDCESLEIVKSWDKRITKMFIIYKYIDGKAILFDRDNIYEVSGIVSAISELYPISKLPTAIYTTLLPFKDQIIYDGMIASYDEKFDFIKPEVLNKMFELKKDKIIKKL